MLKKGFHNGGNYVSEILQKNLKQTSRKPNEKSKIYTRRKHEGNGKSPWSPGGYKQQGG